MNFLRSLLWLMVGFLLAVNVNLAFAAGTVPSGDSWRSYFGNVDGRFSSAQASCMDTQRLNFYFGSSVGITFNSFNWVSGSDASHGVGSYGQCYVNRNGSMTYANNASIAAVGVCPENSTGTTTCTCNTGFEPASNGSSACWPSMYQGSQQLSVCTINGCTGSTFDTAQAACESFSFGQNTAYPSIATYMGNGTCKFKRCYSDGSCKTDYFSITNTAVCPAGDAACAAARSGESTAAASSVSASTTADKTASTASAVAAATTAAGDAAAAAAEAAGMDASGVAAARTQAQIYNSAQVAAGAAASGQSPEQNDACDVIANPQGCLGTVPAPDLVTRDNPTFDTSSIPFATSNSCPADISFTMLGQSHILSYQPLCDFAQWVRPIFLALAAATAAFIFVSGLII